MRHTCINVSPDNTFITENCSVECIRPFVVQRRKSYAQACRQRVCANKCCVVMNIKLNESYCMVIERWEIQARGNKSEQVNCNSPLSLDLI